MKRGRTRLFLENILIYGLGSTMNMIIPFIMLPIITRLLPDSEYYGINDSVVIFVSVGSAIVMMGMYDAMYRFYFDNEDETYRKEVCSSTLYTLVVTGSAVMLIVLMFREPMADIFFSDNRYAPLIIVAGLNIWVTSISTIVAAPTRMRNQRVRYISIQTVAPVISYCLSILLIYKGEYVYALPLASLLSNIIVCTVFYMLNRQDFSINSFNQVILGSMLRFGVPLMPTSIFFWMLSSAGRVFVTNTWGLEYTGIYAAAGKIAAVSQVIYSAFAGGWQYFAFSTMNDEDYVELISRLFDYLAGMSFFLTAALVLVLKPIYTIMLPAQYAQGIAIVPMQFFAPLVLMLRQTIGMHFQVEKSSVLGMFTIAFGALVAMALYYLLIPSFGINGAAVASLSGYISALLITIVILKKKNLILISKRIYVGFTITIAVLSLYMSSVSTVIVHIIATVQCIVLFLAYRSDVMRLKSGITKPSDGPSSS